MNLLIVTPTVDRHDPILGFFHRWLEEFAKNVTHLTVICLRRGDYALPSNVRVFSLGQEGKVSHLRAIARFYRLIVTERKNYDSVLVHMTPEYIVLGGIVWRVLGKYIALWYAHKSVTVRLRVATFFADTIFSASKESFRLATKKLRITGHGIDCGTFEKVSRKADGITSILSVSRISPIKRIELIIDATALVVQKGIDARLIIVGAPAYQKDFSYEKELKKHAKTIHIDSSVSFMGPISHERIPSILDHVDVFVNMSETGSVDKAVLEAMAAGIPVISANEAFADILPKERFIHTNAEELAHAIEQIPEGLYDKSAVAYVAQNHNLPNLIARITQSMHTVHNQRS